MRVLVLHGFNGSGQKILRRGASLWDSFRSRTWEVETCDAPFLERNEMSRTWWKSSEDYEGLIDSLCCLNALKAPDIIVGFSQGAILTSIICGMQNNEESRWLKHKKLCTSVMKQVKGVVLISGFQPTYKLMREAVYTTPIKVPSLHIIGECDKIVLPKDSLLLSNKYVHPSILHHKGAHDIPTKEHNQLIIDQIMQFCKPEKK